MRINIERKGDEVKKQIDKHYDALIKKLTKQRDELKQQVGNVVSLKKKSVTKQLQELGNAHKELLKTEKLKEVVENSSDHEVLSTEKEVKHCMQQVTNQYKKVSKNPVQSDNMEFHPSNLQFPQFGTVLVPDPIAIKVLSLPTHAFVNQPVVVNIVTMDHNGQQCCKKGSEVFAVVEDGKETHDLQVKDNKNGTYRTFYVATQPGKMKLSAQLNGQTL